MFPITAGTAGLTMPVYSSSWAGPHAYMDGLERWIYSRYHSDITRTFINHWRIQASAHRAAIPPVTANKANALQPAKNPGHF